MRAAMNIVELRKWAKVIDPRLSLAYHGPNRIDVRVYDNPRYPHVWTRVAVMQSLRDTEKFLAGINAAHRIDASASGLS